MWHKYGPAIEQFWRPATEPARGRRVPTAMILGVISGMNSDNPPMPPPAPPMDVPPPEGPVPVEEPPAPIPVPPDPGSPPLQLM